MNNPFIVYIIYGSLILLAAKLWNRIDWSWWVVVLPFILLILLGQLTILWQWRRRKTLTRKDIDNLAKVQHIVGKVFPEYRAMWPVDNREKERH